MADISKITLPSGSSYDLKDKYRVHPVIGTQTKSTNVWTGEIDVDELYDGIAIAYFLPYAGNSSSATLTLTLANGETTAPIAVYAMNNSRATTHYGAGSTIFLTFWSAGSISVSGTSTTDDRWTSFNYNSDTTTHNRITYFAGKTGSKGIWAYGLFMEDQYGTFQNICTGADGTVTANTRTTATTKIANTNGFKVCGTIFYTNSTYNANTNINGNCVVYSSISTFDTRYSFNTTLTAGSLTTYKPLYLVGTIASDGLFYLDTVWWTQTPTDTSKVYVLVGGVYDSSTSYCRATLYEQNKWYRYDGTMLIEISNDAITVNGHTVESDVPQNAVFTDTTYDLGQHPTYLNTLTFTETSSGGGSSVSSIMIPTIVRGTMNNDSSTSTAFVVSASNTITSLYDGLAFIIKNTKVTSATNCTLNVNDLGAKRIWLSQSNSYCTAHWAKNQTYLFVYDATNDRFELQQGRDTDSIDVSTYRPKSTKTYVGGNGLKAYSLYAKLRGSASATTAAVTVNLDSYSSFTTNSGTGTKTYGTQVFDFTKLYFFNWEGDNKSGTYAGNNGRTYAVSGIDLRYTLNITTSSLTIDAPLYLIFYATSDFETKYGQIANSVNSGYPVYTQDIGATLTAIHNNSTLEANISRIRFVYVGTPYSKYQVELDLFNHVYMPNPTVANANKWKSAPILANGAVSYNTDRAVNDSDGNRFQDTYWNRTTSLHTYDLTQDTTDGHIIYFYEYGASSAGGTANLKNTITVPDNNTTYGLSRDGSSVKLTPSSGSAQTVSLSDLITGLDVGTSNADKDDYLVSQYVGGGSSNNNYYRRKIANIVNEAVVKNALSNFIYTVGSTGTIKGGTTASGYYTNNGTYIYFNIPIPKMIDPAVTTITFNRCCGNTRFYNGYYFPNSYQSNGYDFVNEWSGAGFAILRDRCVGTNILIRIDSSKYTGVPKASGTNGLVSLVIESDITVTFN